MKREILERLGADLGTVLLGLLVAPSHHLGHLLGVLARVGDDRNRHRNRRIVLTDRRDDDGALGQLEEFLERHPHLVLHRVAGGLELVGEIGADRPHRRVVPELTILALAERLAEFDGVVDLDEEDGRIREHALRRRRGLSEIRLQSHETRQSQPSDEGQAKNRPLGLRHRLSLHSWHATVHRPRRIDLPTAISRPSASCTPRSKPGASPAVTDEPFSV